MSMELKLDIGLCRCCHAQGMFHNLSTPFVCQGHEEIYSEMLRDCMNIMITPLEGEYSTSTYTICDTCALKLRDANEFKKQVLECEERFKEVCKEVMKSLQPMDVEIKQEMEDDDNEDDQPLKHEPSDDDMDMAEDGFEVKLEGLKDESVTTLKEAKREEQIKVRSRKPRAASTKAKPIVKVKKQNRVGMPKRQKKNTANNETEETSATQKKTISKKKNAKQVADESKKDLVRLVDPKEYRVSESATRGHKFTCNRCDSVFKTLTYVRKHIATIHLNWKSLQCDLCPETFKYYHNKQAHLQKEHGIQVKRYKKRVVEGTYICDTCNAYFKIRGELVKHIKKVHLEYKCQHCDQYFRKNRLVLHLDEAHNIPAPTCGVCGFKDFARARILRHQREVHMREKNCFCPYCESSFFNSTQLRNHIIKHTGERNFLCNICHKTFARKSALRIHYKIHTGEKRKVCHVCQQAFVQKASLNYHMTKHHPEQP